MSGSGAAHVRRRSATARAFFDAARGRCASHVDCAICCTILCSSVVTWRSLGQLQGRSDDTLRQRSDGQLTPCVYLTDRIGHGLVLEPPKLRVPEYSLQLSRNPHIGTSSQL
jgi:hypothetical protein